jgi:hypothetical protein
MAIQIVLSRKEDVRRLEEEGEEGMVHSLLNGLPDIYDEEPSPRIKSDDPVKVEIDDIPALDCEVLINGRATSNEPAENVSLRDSTDIPSPGDSPFSNTVALPKEELKESLVEPDLVLTAVPDSEVCLSDGPVVPPPPMEGDEKPGCSLLDPPQRRHRAMVSLSSLLARADELLASYPPTHPDLSLSSIMGPQSVIFTWSEDPSELPEDDDAEDMVAKPELVVYPYIPSEPPSDSEELGDKQMEKRKRRKLRKPARYVSIMTDRRTILAGAVLALSVAVAVYGMHARDPGVLGAVHVGRRVKGWLGCALIGVSDKVMSGFGLL